MLEPEPEPHPQLHSHRQQTTPPSQIHLMVTVPAGAKVFPGQAIRFESSDGRVATVIATADARPGSRLRVKLPPAHDSPKQTGCGPADQDLPLRPAQPEPPAQCPMQPPAGAEHGSRRQAHRTIGWGKICLGVAGGTALDGAIKSSDADAIEIDMDRTARYGRPSSLPPPEPGKLWWRRTDVSGSAGQLVQLTPAQQRLVLRNLGELGIEPVPQVDDEGNPLPTGVP